MRFLPRSNGHLSADDAYVIKIVLAWFVAFVGLFWSMRNADVFLSLFLWLVGDNPFAPVAVLSTLLLLLSVIYGSLVTFGKAGRGMISASMILVVVNTIWIALVLARGTQGGLPLLVFAWIGTFMVTWLGFQVPGKLLSYTLWATPVMVAAWLFSGDGIIVWGVAVALMCVLSLVLVYGISMVEGTSVDRRQKAISMLLFVQSAALFLILIKTIVEHGSASAGNLLKMGRDTANIPAAAASAMCPQSATNADDDEAVKWIISVFSGSPWAAFFYSATIHGILLASWHLISASDAGLAVMFTVLWAVLMASTLLERPVSWGGFFVVAGLQAMLTGFFMIPAVLALSRGAA